MGLAQRLADLREKQILEHAEPFLDDGEEVIAWVRTTRAHRSGRGLLFVTDKRVVVSWSRIGPDEDHAISWDKIVSWGFAPDGDRGPLFAIETEDALHYGHVLVGTQGMVNNANTFLVHFIDKAPLPRRPLRSVPDPEGFNPTEIRLERERMTVGKHTRRVIVTIIGVILLAAGVVLLVAPGPGILVTFAGLAVLGSEYDWAGDFLSWVKQRYARARAKLRARRSTVD